MMERKSDNEAVSLGDILLIVLRNWYWYVISIALSLGVAFYKVKSSQVIYERHATVLIKSQGAYSQMQDEAAVFRELDMPSDGGYLVDNELLVFKARRLMEEVVRRLELDVDYVTPGRFREWTDYSCTPVHLRFPDAGDDQAFSLTVTPKPDHSFMLHDFHYQGESYTSNVLACVGDTVTTPVGRVIVLANMKRGATPMIGEDIVVRHSNPVWVASSLSGRLQTSLASKTGTIIKLSMTDQSPQRAEDVLNTLVTVYDEDAINDKNRVAVNTEKFINEQLEILEQELDGIDMVLANYKSTNRLTDLHSDASAYRTTANSVEQHLSELQNQRSVAQFILNYIQERDSSESRFEVIPNNAGIGNQQVESLISEYNTQTLLREKLKTDAGERNPQVEDLTNSVDQMRNRIVVSIRNLIESLDIEINGVRKRVGESNVRLRQMPSQQMTVTGVERQQSTKEELYMYLLSKRQENALSKCITQSNARILDPAMGSGAPVSPNRKFIMMAGAFAGLLIPTVLLFLLMVGDTKVRSKRDLAKLASIPLVGEIPQKKGTRWSVRKAKQHGHRRRRHSDKTNVGQRIVFSAKSRDTVSESIRILRTNLSYLGGSQGKRQVIMLTSFMPGAGKTFVGINLGMSFAVSGSKVLMLDLDIRRGSLSAEHNKGRAGITDYLGGFERNLDNIILRSVYHENMDMIPMGHRAPNPAELLMDPVLDSLMDELRGMYDYIIVDCVPANIVADAMICNRFADITLFVIRSGNLDKRLLPEVENMFISGKLANMAVVLNGISDSHVYGSGYGYGYGYGYYGYSNYYSEEEK